MKNEVKEESGYTKIFDSDPVMNLKILKDIQHCCNDELKSRGFLFLNDIYEMLGIPKKLSTEDDIMYEYSA